MADKLRDAARAALDWMVMHREKETATYTCTCARCVEMDGTIMALKEALAEPAPTPGLRERVEADIALLLDVNRRAETRMLKGEQITGAHHRSIEEVLDEKRALLSLTDRDEDDTIQSHVRSRESEGVSSSVQGGAPRQGEGVASTLQGNSSPKAQGDEQGAQTGDLRKRGIAHQAESEQPSAEQHPTERSLRDVRAEGEGSASPGLQIPSRGGSSVQAVSREDSQQEVAPQPEADAAVVERVAEYIYQCNTYDEHGPSMNYAREQARRILAIFQGGKP